MYRVSIKNNLRLTKNLLYILNDFSYKFPILETTASWKFPHFRNYGIMEIPPF